MKNFKIDKQDLLALQAASFCVSGHLSFSIFEDQCKKDYAKYTLGRENPKTFSQWVNAQTVALTTPF